MDIEEIVTILYSLMSGRHETQINWPAESMEMAGHGALKQRHCLGISESLLYSKYWGDIFAYAKIVPEFHLCYLIVVTKSAMSGPLTRHHISVSTEFSLLLVRYRFAQQGGEMNTRLAAERFVRNYDWIRLNYI